MNILPVDDNELVIGGVVSNNSAEWLHEDAFEGIDLDWEEHLLTCKEEDDHDLCWDGMGSTILIGFVGCSANDDQAFFVLSDGQTAYKIDDQAEYSAIYGEIYTQVVKSRFMVQCRMCSPCYPGQGDLDSLDNVNGFWAYSLPADVMGSMD